MPNNWPVLPPVTKTTRRGCRCHCIQVTQWRLYHLDALTSCQCTSNKCQLHDRTHLHTHIDEDDCRLSRVIACCPRPIRSGEISFHAYKDYARGILNKAIYILSNIENSSVIAWLEWRLDHVLWGMTLLMDRCQVFLTHFMSSLLSDTTTYKHHNKCIFNVGDKFLV